MPRAAAIIALTACLALVTGAGAQDEELQSRKAKAARRDLDRALASATRAFEQRALSAQRAYRTMLEDAQKAAMRESHLEEARRIQDALDWLERSIAALADGRASDRVTDARELESDLARDAQRAYRDAIAEAGRGLKAARRAALTEYKAGLEGALRAVTRAADDLDEAERLSAAIRRVQAQLDALRAEEGWVTLFRSLHPEDWNTARDAPDRFALPLDLAPRELTYLRLRRVDTQAYVVIPLTWEQLGGVVDDRRYGWMGAKVVNEGAVHLGIDNGAWELTYRDGGRIYIGPRSASGWGFGHKVHANDRQYCAWAGEEIAAVAFEVSVTARELDDEERAFLLVGE
jgi:hypothetical protein